MKSNLLSLFVLFLAVMIPFKMVSQTTCPVPTNTTTTNIHSNGATLTWTSPAGTIANIVQYRVVTVPESQWINVTTQSSSLTLTNLACGMNYQWRVAGFCTNGATVPGAYSTIVNFTTLACNTACVAPLNLHATNITSTGATLSWTAATGALAYIVQYRLQISAGAAWTTVNTSASSLTLTTLICGATYEWRVATICGTTVGNTSPYSATVHFITAACTTTCIAPSGLTTTNITHSSATLSWNAPTNAYAYVIQYRPVTTPESQWINVSTQNPASAFTLNNLHCATAYQWHVAARCNNGTTVIGPYSPMAYFTTAPCTTNCVAPTGLAVNTTPTSTVLTWNTVTGALAYTIQYRPVTTPESAWISGTTQSTSFTLANLPCGKNYQWHVNSICNTSSNTGTSPYSPMAYFTTVPCVSNCTAPINLHTTNIAVNGATFSWTGPAGALSYIVQYRLTSATTWTTVNTQAASLALTNLHCGSSYLWRVAAICGTAAGNTSPYSITANFVTLACPPCSAPTGLGTTNITATGATLSWTATGNAYAYIIQYRPVTNPAAAWINVTTQNPATAFTLTNLHCGTAYQWHIAAYCNNSAGAIGPYSAMAYFTTAACTTACAAPTGLISSTIPAIPGTVLSWTGSAGALTYILQYRPISSPVSSWITVNTQSTTYTIFALACGTNYQWHVQAVCNTASNGGSSPYSAMAYFTTLPCTNPVCAVPAGLTSAPVTSNSTSRMLNWNTTGATNYNIRYRIINAATWQTTTSATNSKLINGLLLSSHYEWQVQSVCATNAGVAITSAWSQSANFVTPVSRPVFPNPASGNTIQVPLVTDNETGIRITISDYMGRVAKTMYMHIPKGGLTLEVDIANLDAGMYFIKISNGSEDEIQKLFIIK